MQVSRDRKGVLVVLGALGLAWVVSGAMPAKAGADADDAPAVAPNRYYDTGRFYLTLQSGHRFVLDETLVDDVELTEANGFNLVLGGGGGYNLTDHWGIELQAHGTESDIRDKAAGRKLQEYSNITMVGAVRYRWPLHDGRLVPFVTGGVGMSINDINDQHDPRVKVQGDDTTLVGALAAGAEYFLNPDVAVGLTLHSLIFPGQDTRVVTRAPNNVIVSDRHGSLNQTSVEILAHLRIYPGQAGEPGDMSLRRFLFSNQGPYDTDDRRFYFYVMGGHTAMFDHKFGGDVELADPGGFNATLGTGLGVNLDKHWGLELQWFDVAPNVNARPYGKFTEIDNITALLLGRFRYAFCKGRLVTYATAGVGAGTFDLNDSRTVVDVPTVQGTASTQRTPFVAVQATTVAAQLGVGVEYFLSRHLSFGIALPAYLYPDVSTRVQRPKQAQVGGKANFSGIAPQLVLKAYFN